MISKSIPVFYNETSLIIVNTSIPSYYSNHLLPPLWSIFSSIISVIAIYYLVIPLFWMVVYEAKYGKGEEYFNGKLSKEEKRKLKENFSWKKYLQNKRS